MFFVFVAITKKLKFTGKFKISISFYSSTVPVPVIIFFYRF